MLAQCRAERFVAFFDCDRSLGKTLSDAVGYDTQPFRRFVQLTQPPIQLQYAQNGHNKIREQHRIKHGEQDHGQLNRNQRHELCNERVRYIDDKHAGQSPQQRKQQADIAADIQRAL